MAKKQRYRQKWSTTARRWMKRNNVPNGFRLILERRDKTRVRSDIIVTRYAIPKRSDDDLNLRAALDELKGVMITDFDARGFSIVLLDAQGAKVGGGKTMGNIRKMPGKPTADEIEEAELEEAEINRIAEDVCSEIRDLRRENYPNRFLRAVIRALVEMEGENDLMDALREEGYA